MQIRLQRTIAATVLLGVLATACGGDDDGTVTDGEDAAAAAPEATTPVTEEGEAAESPQPEAQAPSAPGTSGAAGAGFVDIDGTRYDVNVVRCFNMAGALGGSFDGADDPDNVSGNFSFSPNDWATRNASEGWTDSGSLTLRSDDPYLHFESGAELVEFYVMPDGVTADDLEITSYLIDDKATSVRGEAMFLDVNGLMTGVTTGPLPGSFEFSCPPS